MLTEEPDFYHATVDTAFFKSLVERGATVEIIELALSPEINNEQKRRVEEAVKASEGGEGSGYLGRTWGWAVERTACTIIYGWHNLEACEAFQSTQASKDAVEILENAPGVPVSVAAFSRDPHSSEVGSVVHLRVLLAISRSGKFQTPESMVLLSVTISSSFLLSPLLTSTRAAYRVPTSAECPL